MNTLAMLTSGTALTKTVALTTVPERITRRSGAEITSITSRVIGVGNHQTMYYAEVTIDPAVLPHGHGYVNGAVVHVSGVTQPAYNVVAAIQVMSRFVFRYRLIEPPEAALATGAPEFYADIKIRRIVLWGRTSQATSNVANVHVGWEAEDGLALHRLVPDWEILYEGAQGAKFNLANLYLDVDAAGEGVVGYYH